MAEAMIAILFISIALFGYISLHMRIIHSGSKLETRQDKREAVGAKLITAMLQARYKDVAGVPSGAGAPSPSSGQRPGLPAEAPPTARPGMNGGSGGYAPAGYENSGFWSDTVPPKGYYDFQGWANTTRPPGYDDWSWANTTAPPGMTTPGSIYEQQPDAYESIGAISYTEAFIQTSTNGLPEGLTQVNASTSWTDRQGNHTYLVDAYERRALPGW